VTTSRLLLLLSLITIALFACRPASSKALEVPPGTDIVVNKIDGTSAAGKLIGVEGREVVVRNATGRDVRIAYSDIASVRATLAASNTPKRATKTAQEANSSDATPPTSQPSIDPSRFKDFQVAAGTRLSIELSTPLASDANRIDDQVKGRLRDALVVDGVELVPSGSVVLGTVTEAAQAVRDEDRGRIAVRFSVIEHPNTGSRVAIRTAPLAFESDATLKNARAAASRAPANPGAAPASEARVNPGTVLSATLLAPFVVRIPTP
jgi:hypothetical protein